MNPAVLKSSLVALLLPACLPVITHSPQLVPGNTWGMLIGFEGGPKPNPNPNLAYTSKALEQAVFISHSWVQRDGTGWGATVGALYKIPTELQGDVFVRAPRFVPLRLDAGIGMILYGGILHGSLPYAQLGVALPARVYVYTTQGSISVSHERYGGTQGTDQPWLSQVGIEFPLTKPDSPWRDRISFQAGALIGSVEDHCTGEPVGCWHPGQLFVRMVITVEVKPRRSRRRS